MTADSEAMCVQYLRCCSLQTTRQMGEATREEASLGHDCSNPGCFIDAGLDRVMIQDVLSGARMRGSVRLGLGGKDVAAGDHDGETQRCRALPARKQCVDSTCLVWLVCRMTLCCDLTSLATREESHTLVHLGHPQPRSPLSAREAPSRGCPELFYIDTLPLPALPTCKPPSHTRTTYTSTINPITTHLRRDNAAGNR
ncbi:hypothetical protein BDU57DRAFT_29811 [Ampelomyces quisqualis]|uniref:Uncharacterized protein n=1 Tax=Ampelomyces quisqualis TaxID=50730 RepID=A0A6A5R4Q8_AMPQU|nr:hypothetical protein BDU57DRAFT_29811 [Ampelomyces quisqualis]